MRNIDDSNQEVWPPLKMQFFGGIVFALVAASGASAGEHDATPAELPKTGSPAQPSERARQQFPPRGKLFLACNADRLRLEIVGDGHGGFLLRTSRPIRNGQSVLLFELSGGSEGVEGTGVCAHRIWTFPQGKDSIVIAGLGCAPDSNPPPENAIAQLTSYLQGLPSTSAWCFNPAGSREP